MKIKNLVRLVIWTNDKRNIHLTNTSDTDMKTTKLKNVQKLLNITRIDEIKTHISERDNRAVQRECNNSDTENDQKIYASTACISDNDQITGRYFGEISQ